MLIPLRSRRPESHREILGHYGSALQAEILMTGEDSKITRERREFFESREQEYHTEYHVQATLDTKLRYKE